MDCHPRIARVAAVMLLGAAGMAQALEPCGKNHYILDEACILEWAPVSRGLADLDVHVIAADPTRGQTVYAGGPSGVFKSFDGGGNWHPAGPMMHLHDAAIAAGRMQFRLPAGFSGKSRVAHLAIDRRSPQTLYAATVPESGCVWMQRHVFKSVDGGATWTNDISPPINGCDAVHTLVLAPSAPGALYLTNGDAGDAASPVIMSLDGASSWTPLEYLDLHALAVDPQDSRTVFAGTSWYTNPYTSLPSGVLKSQDGGASWTATTLVGTGISALAVDPSDSRVVYAVARNSPHSSNGGVFKSVDGGSRWAAIIQGLGDLLSRTVATAVVVDASDGRNVYLATRDGGIWRSMDAGATWMDFSDGLPHVAIRSLALVSGKPNVLYAATSMGVFRIDDVVAARTSKLSGLNRF